MNNEERLLEAYIDDMDEILEKARKLPMSNKNYVVDVEQLRDCIDHIRMNIPSEIKQAKKIVQERKSIIDEAHKQADDIVTKAENRANALVANSEITKAAEAKAVEIERQALIKAKAVKNAADEYLAGILTDSEKILASSLMSIRSAKSTLKVKPSANPNIPVNNQMNMPNQ